MKIAFITSHIKTRFFHGVATRLEQAGHEVYWLSPSHTWAQWLLQQGVPADQVLDIERFGPEWSAQPQLAPEQLETLRSIEATSGWTMKNLIQMDRLLSAKPHAYAMAYLWVCQRELTQFLTRHGVQAVFMEATWAFELITVQVCKHLGIHIQSPQTTRIPDGRFAFFDGQLQDEFTRWREPQPADYEQAVALIAHFKTKKPKPTYFHRNNQIPTFKREWIGKLFFHFRYARVDRFNETRFPISNLVTNRLREVFNTWRARLANPFVTPDLPPKRPFVLLTLHKQPESSIDVYGPSTSNQLELIRALARTLPATHDLYVKEHSNAIGDRSVDFYRQARQVPGVVLVDPFMDSFRLLEHAALVATVSGTIAYEAGLLGVPAMTMTPMYFTPLLSLPGCNVFENYGRAVMDFLNRGPQVRPDQGEGERVAFLAQLLAASFPGVISDPGSDPTCMDASNLDKVTEGFRCLLENGLDRTGASQTASTLS